LGPFMISLILVACAGSDVEKQDANGGCSVQTNSDLRTRAYFMGQAAGHVLESLPISCHSVRVGNTSSFHRDGWAWRPVDNIVQEAVSGLREACLVSNTRPAWDNYPPIAPLETLEATAHKTTIKSCMVSYFQTRPKMAQAMAQRLAYVLESELQSDLSKLSINQNEPLRVECEVDPSRWTLFVRSGDSPQNMHYDTVASESENGCEAMTPSEDGPDGFMNVRYGAFCSIALPLIHSYHSYTYTLIYTHSYTLILIYTHRPTHTLKHSYSYTPILIRSNTHTLMRSFHTPYIQELDADYPRE
jgi:hypothetical protein